MNSLNKITNWHISPPILALEEFLMTDPHSVEYVNTQTDREMYYLFNNYFGHYFWLDARFAFLKITDKTYQI